MRVHKKAGSGGDKNGMHERMLSDPRKRYMRLMVFLEQKKAEEEEEAAAAEKTAVEAEANVDPAETSRSSVGIESNLGSRRDYFGM